MTRSQKVLGAAVVLIVVLFVWVVACGGRTGDGDASGPGGFVEALGDWVGGAAAADPADLSADCMDETGRLVVEGSCMLTVAPGGAPLRMVKLFAQDDIEVTAPAPRGGADVTDEVEAGSDISVAVGTDGAEIELYCGLLQTCVVTLPRED